MKKLIILLIVLPLMIGCATSSDFIRTNNSNTYSSKPSNYDILILSSTPDSNYIEIGIVSADKQAATKYGRVKEKDLIPKLKEAGRRIGADALINLKFETYVKSAIFSSSNKHALKATATAIIFEDKSVSESSEYTPDKTTKNPTMNVNNRSEPKIETTQGMTDIITELTHENERPTYIAIKKVLNKYILLYKGKETPMVIEDEYPIVRGMGSGKFLTIGTAKVVKIKGTAVALKPSLERRYQPVTILDRVEYIQKMTNDN